MMNPKFYGSTIVSDKGQVVIPAEARNELDINKGEKMLVMGMKGDSLLLVKVSSFKKLSEEMSKRQSVINKIVEEL